MKDEEIIEKLEKRDESCFRHLYRHLKMVECWVMKNNGDKDDASDLFQNALIVFYENVRMGKYKRRAKISTFLFAICRNQWLNELKRRSKHVLTGEDDFIFDKARPATETKKPEMDDPLKCYIESGLDQLGKPCRSLLEACIYLKLNMKDIAKKFHYKNAESARQQKLRCLKKIRGLISYEKIVELQ